MISNNCEYRRLGNACILLFYGVFSTVAWFKVYCKWVKWKIQNWEFGPGSEASYNVEVKAL